MPSFQCTFKFLPILCFYFPVIVLSSQLLPPRLHVDPFLLPPNTHFDPTLQKGQAAFDSSHRHGGVEASHFPQNSIALRPHPEFFALFFFCFPSAENIFSSLQFSLSSPFPSVDPFPVTVSEVGLRGGRMQDLPAKKKKKKAAMIFWVEHWICSQECRIPRWH